jgi:hypothetical protein
MAVSLTLQSCTFCFPEEGANPGHGEVVTDWASKVNSLLSSLIGAGDILTTTACIACNQACAASVTLLSFATSTVRSFEVCYNVVRGACNNIVETGVMRGVYNGTSWSFTNACIAGCAGMSFQITNAGQVQYFSDNQGTGTIKFRASTFDL